MVGQHFEWLLAIYYSWKIKVQQADCRGREDRAFRNMAGEKAVWRQDLERRRHSPLLSLCAEDALLLRIIRHPLAFPRTLVALPSRTSSLGMCPTCLAPQVAALSNGTLFSRRRGTKLPKHIHWKEEDSSTDFVIRRKQREDMAVYFPKHQGKNNWL